MTPDKDTQSMANKDMIPGLRTILAQSQTSGEVEELPARCCGRCAHGHMPEFPPGMPIDFSVRECHAQPPHTQFFMVPAGPPTKDGRQNFNIMEHTGWPKVKSNKVCGMFWNGRPSQLQPQEGTTTRDSDPA